MCIVGFFFKDNVNEWVTSTCDRTGPADESKRTKRVQGWSRLNWLGGILIIVSWHIYFDKLLMSLTPVCCIQRTSRERASADAETDSSGSEAASESTVSVSDFDAYSNS